MAFKNLNHTRKSQDQTRSDAQSFRRLLEQRRSVREFSSDPVPTEVIEDLIMTASAAPSGANKQPWSFCAVRDPATKRGIRIAAEKEEKLNYGGRMSDEWLRDLEPFGTTWEKPFLESAPWLIVVFKQTYEQLPGQIRRKNYYVNESVGIAAGFLIAAIHHAGLCTLTHTPSPMNFLEKVLNRPKNERAFLLLPVGYPASTAKVPDITKKSVPQVITYF